MKKPLLQEAFDQSIHFVVGFLGVLFVQPPQIWQAALMGFLLGSVREFTEGGNVFSAGSLRDLAFWTLGGLIGGVSLTAFA